MKGVCCQRKRERSLVLSSQPLASGRGSEPLPLEVSSPLFHILSVEENATLQMRTKKSILYDGI